MTSTIKQQVVPRHRHFAQQGNINSGTISVVLAVTVIIGIATLSFFYLNQVINTASQGGDIQQLENHLTELKEKQRQLEIDGAHLRSIQAIEDNIDQLNLVSTDHVAYLQSTPHRVASLRQ